MRLVGRVTVVVEDEQQDDEDALVEELAPALQCGGGTSFTCHLQNQHNNHHISRPSQQAFNGQGAGTAAARGFKTRFS